MSTTLNKINAYNGELIQKELFDIIDANAITTESTLNDHSNKIGDLTGLSTTDKTSLVGAIKENTTNLSNVKTDLSTNYAKKTDLQTIQDNVTNTITPTLATKVDKNGNEQITLAMLSQEVKQTMTGGSVAVVSSNAINTSNVVEKAIIPQKTDFFNYKFKNLSYLCSDIVSYTNNSVVTSAVYGNGTVNFTFSGIAEIWIKLTGLENGKQYYLFLNNNGWVAFKRYNSTKTTVLQNLSDFSNTNRQKYYTAFTATEDTMYIYLNNSGGSLTPSISYWKLYQITDVNEITGYYDVITNTINEYPTLKDNLISKNSEFNGLVGNAIGDSITYGATNNGISYVHYISEYLGIKYNNYGVSGELIGNFIPRIANMQANVNFITILGGTNDFNGNEPLGSATDEASVTSGTFYGRYRCLIETALAKWTNVPIILITPPQRAYQGTDATSYTGMINGNGLKLSQYVTIIKELALEYGLPVIDLYSISGIAPHNITTYTNDGLHPNDIGHHRLASIIADYIKRYIQIN